MKTLTTGHLNTNGGVRGHSAGEFFPFMIMSQGPIDDLKYYVIKPDGKKIGAGLTNIKSAFFIARMAYGLWSMEA